MSQKWQVQGITFEIDWATKLTFLFFHFECVLCMNLTTYYRPHHPNLKFWSLNAIDKKATILGQFCSYFHRLTNSWIYRLDWTHIVDFLLIAFNYQNSKWGDEVCICMNSIRNDFIMQSHIFFFIANCTYSEKNQN